MDKQQICKVTIPDPKYRNDVLHPCIRHSEEGFAGHHWWMVASPWYDCNDAIENPLLFWGDSCDDGTPPIEWHFADTVVDTPAQGYNSDPNLFFEQGHMVIVWREFQTPRVVEQGYNSAVYAVNYDCFLVRNNERLLTGDPSSIDLDDLSPILYATDEGTRLYTMHYLIDRRPFWLYRKVAAKLWSLLSRTNRSFDRTLGLAESAYETSSAQFKACRTLRFTGAPAQHLTPWHFDMVTYENRTLIIFYSVLKENIYLGELMADSVYVLGPLFADHALRSTYKPTGVVIDHTLYIYFTDKVDPSDTKRNLLIRREFNIDILLYD